MPLFKSSRDHGHNHLLYVGPDGSGLSSLDKKHVHAVSIDPTTGAMTVHPGGDDNHAHQILAEDLNAPVNVPDENDQEVVAEVWRLFKVAKEINKDSFEDAEESEEFYRGDQWEDSEKSQLQSEQRAALTVNEIESKLDLLSGFQRQGRTEIRYSGAVDEADQLRADIYNIVAKQVLNRTNYAENETEIFEDTTIGWPGTLNFYTDYSKDIEGEIVVERFDPHDIVLGAHSKKDLSDLEYMLKKKVFSEANARAMWPEKAEKISEVSRRFVDTGKVPDVIPVDQSDEAKPSGGLIVAGEIIIDIARKTFLVVECWRKMHYTSHVLFNEQHDYSFKAVKWSKQDVKRLLSIPGFIAIPRVETVMRVTRVAGDVLLSDEIPVTGKKDFPIAVLYAKKRGNRYWGKVKPVKDLQREENKRRSQLVDIVNKMASYGWFYDSNTFPDKQEQQKFVSDSGKPAFTIEVSDTGRPPIKSEGIRFPVEIANLEIQMNEKIREIMNIPKELQGLSDTGQSGIAILRKQRQGLVGNEYLFDNLSIMKRRVGRLLLMFIRDVYTPERILRIVENVSRTKPEQVKLTMGRDQTPLPNPLTEENRARILELLADDDPTKYDIVVTESPESVSVRQSTLMTLVELVKGGAPIPPQIIMRYSEVPRDVQEEIIAGLNAAEQARQQEVQAKNQTEIMKTVIAKKGGGVEELQ